MPSAEIYAGVSQGLGQVAQYNQERPERESRRAEASMRREKSVMEMDEFKQQAPNREAMSDVRLAKAEGELYTMRATALQTDTFAAFKMYNGEREPRHLNNFLQKAKANPAGQSIWGNWARFDTVQRTTENEAMLGQAGLTAEGIDMYFKEPGLQNFVIGTDIQGKQSLVDMNKVNVATGYARHMGQQELADAKLAAQTSNLLRGQTDANTQAILNLQADEESRGNSLSYQEAMNIYFDAKNSQKKTGSTVEREADRLQQDNPGMGRTEALNKSKLTLEGRTSSMKNVDATQGIRDSLNGLNPDEKGDFYDLDLSDPKVRQRAGEQIVALEQITGKKPSNEEKRVGRQLRSLLSLSTVAGSELSEDETGIIDNMFHGVKKYFSDNVEGTEGTASYHSFRNVMRNALMGATLTKSEIKSFDKAAGTLGMQLGPVLAHLKVSMEDVRNQIGSLARDMDPMAAKYYLGTDMESAEVALDAIDERIRMVADKQESRERGDKLTVKQATGAAPTIAPKVKVVIPQATVDGTKPTMSAGERFKQLQGGK
mgnify:CR=1 FL=1|tara:strand:+ start:11653 stop:13281 length:1629 start_codon:yes stop_codon:yes gene_type:complete